MRDFQQLIGLVQKYDVPGPRYTSYPTAPHFNSAFRAADHLRRDLISSVMCGLEIDVDAASETHHIDFWAHFGDVLPQLRFLERDGLIEASPSTIRITETGRLFVRNVAMVFDAYLGVRSSETRLYSQTV